VLAHLDAASLTSLARDASVELHGVGTAVIQQGDTGSCMHVIVAGQVLIMIQEQKEQGDNEIKDVLASDWIKSKEESGQVGIRLGNAKQAKKWEFDNRGCMDACYR
jgi:hypothetical protein